MNIIIDASAIIAVLVNESVRPALIAQTVGATLLAPSSIPWEIGNAFSAMLKRKRITLAKAVLALEAYRDIPLRLLDVDLERALTFADQLNIYAYDAYLITCAIDNRCPLLTLDGGLQHAAQVAGVTTLKVQP